MCNAYRETPLNSIQFQLNALRYEEREMQRIIRLLNYTLPNLITQRAKEIKRAMVEIIYYL